MGSLVFNSLLLRLPISFILSCVLYGSVFAQHSDTVICGGFVQSDFPLDYSKIEVHLLDKSGNLKYQAACATNNGNYEVPVFGKKGDFVLIISAPEGLVFEPNRISVHIDGSSDPCSKQENLNFRFLGYALSGKVQSRKSSNGPAGVTVKITDSSNALAATVVTGEDGQFRIPSLLPGVYTLEASHPTFKMHQGKATVKLTEKYLGLPDQSLVVAGYPVSGSVKSSGEPIGGAQFLLFSKDVLDSDVSGCDKTTVAAVRTENSRFGRFVCQVISDQGGKFQFGSLVPSTYNLLPIYTGGGIKYDIEPSNFEFTLGHNALTISKAFEIKGFTASGMVMTSQKGSGVPSADIYINGTLSAKTDKQGRYQLDKTVSGWYKLEAKKDYYDFPTLYVKITPAESTIQPIIARGMSVCGEIRTLRPVSRALTFEAVDMKSGISRDTVIRERENKFCVLLEASEYKVSIFDAPQGPKNQRLVFTPSEKIISLKDFPITDLLFTQILGSISGSFKCLGQCPKDIRVSLLSEAGEVFTDLDAAGAFKFTGIDMGTHVVKIVEPGKRHCWDLVQKTIEVSVAKPTVSVGFVQTGLLFEIWTSHDTEISYGQRNGTQHTSNIKSGFAELCLQQPGQYSVQPKSCHKFEQDIYLYDTSVPERLSIHAVAHLVTISVITDDDKLPFKLRIKKNSDGSSSILSSSGKPKSVGQELYRYDFIEYFPAEEDLTIVPSSETLLFKQSQVELVVSDICEKNVVVMEAFKGILITGETTPAVVDADVVMTTETEILKGKTDAAGKFSLGPIPKSALRDITIDKRGYLFEKINESLNFKASKLSEIRVQMMDASQNPIPGVLVSISSTAGVRTSNFTDQTGSLSFVSFAPGNYLVRPMVKEYKFEPASKSVTLSQGHTAQVDWVGIRVAYSVFGKVGSLGGDPEPGVVFEAVSVEPCPQMQEESASGANGQLRISGLKAGCSYEVRAKEGELARLNLKWTSPASRTISMGMEDVTGLSFMVFRGFNDAEFTGRIATTKEFLNQLKVCLYREDRPDEYIQCISFNVNPMFYFNPVPLDGRGYFLRIDSSLSKKEYIVSSDDLHIKANSTFRHFVMPFSASRRQLEPELDVKTMWMVPISIILAVLYFKREAVIPAAQDLIRRMISGKSFAGSLKDKKKVIAATPISPIEDFDEHSSSSSTLKKRAKQMK